MSMIQDCLIGTDQQGREFVQVPPGHVLCLIPVETAEAHAEWRECAAVRIVTDEDGTVASLEVAPDLDVLTAPEGS